MEKGGSSIWWASARAWATAEAEQQLPSASFSVSAHSSRVTATAGPSWTVRGAATALSTPPLMATRVRAGSCPSWASARTAAPSARARPSEATSAARGAPGRGPPRPELLAGASGAPRARLQDGGATDEGHRGAGGGGRGAAAARGESGVSDAVVLDGDRECDLVTAGAAARDDGMSAGRVVAVALWGREV